MRRFLARLSNMLHREHADREMAREIDSHLALIEDDCIRRGMSPEQARLAARRAYGGVDQTKELHRDARTFVWLEQFLQDVRHAYRALAKGPGFVVVAMLSLAFGIGVNTAVFTLVNGILLKELPAPEPQRIVQVNGRIQEFDTNAFSLPAVWQLRRQTDIFSDVIGFAGSPGLLEINGDSQSVDLEVVTGSYFSFLGGRPELGRLLDADDEREGALPVCVLSHQAWVRHFAGDPGVLGRTVSISGVQLKVIGVAGPAFAGAELQRRYDVWVPTNFPDAEQAVRHSSHFIWIRCLARLKPGVSLAEANARLKSASRGIEESLPKDRANANMIYNLTGASKGFDSWRTRLHDPLTILMAAVSLVLLVACANLANLLLARANDRRQEFAIKLSLGVSRWRLLRQLLIETFALALAGGAAAILLSQILTRYLLDLFNAGNRSAPLQVTADTRVLLFALAACLLTALIAGLYPAWQASRADAAAGLKGASAQGLRPAFVRRGLILVQVVVTVVLLFGASIFSHSLRNLKHIDLGYDIDRVLAVHMSQRGMGNSVSPTAAAPKLAETLARVRQLPGVVSAGYSYPGVLSDWSVALGVKVREASGNIRNLGGISFMTVTPGYFATMRMPLQRGRDFLPSDRAGAPQVVIVNQRLAAKTWPGQDPIGKRLQIGDQEAEVIGLVGNSKYDGFRDDSPRTLFAPLDQRPDLAVAMLVRCRGSFNSVERDVRRIVQAVAPGYQITGVSSLEEQRDSQMSEERALAFLSSLFGVLGTALALVGIYGLISYSVARRTREVGVRISVGAQTRDVLWLFARESLALTGIGVMLGVPLALMLSRFTLKLLYQVPKYDPQGIAITIALLTAGALTASYIPGRRATRIDPAKALRCD